MEHVYEFCSIWEVLHMLYVVFDIGQILHEWFIIGQMLNVYEFCSIWEALHMLHVVFVIGKIVHVVFVNRM